MKKLRNNKGFTLIELVLIILVLGILAVTAIPKFVDMVSEAEQASERGVVGAVRGGIGIIYASNALFSTAGFPSGLGGVNGAGSSSNLLFSSVLNPGIDDPDWSKAGNVYTYAPTTNSYTYTAATGTFQ